MISGGHTAVGVTGRVADAVRLGLDNPTADDALDQLPHHDLTDQTAGQRNRIDR
jgi:hypothetical protein